MNANRGTPGPRYAALLQLFRTAETLWNTSRVFFARWDLSPSQFNILNLVVDLPDGINQAELSRQLLMHRSNVTGLVDRLEARGLVQRHDQEGDRRAYRVVLTPEGRRLVEGILPHYYIVAEQVWGRFPARRANQLMADLTRIAENAQSLAAALVRKP
jgi:DNA-binding MarR family transcriptional regulator